jgi:hypothetical protein
MLPSCTTPYGSCSAHVWVGECRQSRGNNAVMSTHQQHSTFWAAAASLMLQHIFLRAVPTPDTDLT